MRRLALLTGLALLGLSAPASAAVVFGQAAPEGAPQNTCVGNATVVQSATGTAPAYSAPSDGVLTSWTTRAGAGASQEMGLRAYRRDPAAESTFTTVGATALQPLTPNVQNTFAIGPPGIAVRAGDRLGARTGSAGSVNCTWDTTYSGDGVRFALTDPPPGSATSFGSEGSMLRANVQAVLEPDADGDSLGDETQDPDDDNDGVPDASDNCPGTASADTTDMDGDGRGAPCDTDDDVAAPTVALSGFPSSVRRRRLFSRGLQGTIDTNEPAGLEVSLIGVLRGTRITRAGDVILAESTLARAAGPRRVTLRVARRLRPRLRRRARLTLRVAATDAARNRSVVTRRLRVR